MSTPENDKPTPAPGRDKPEDERIPIGPQDVITWN